MANGCFDVFHYGHLRHLEAAALLGDRLVVTVTRNEYVNKGPSRPMFDENQRAAIVRGLRCVDEVILVNSCIEGLRKVKPDLFVKGMDYEGKIEVEHADYCKAHGIKIVFTDEPVYSATKIINDRIRQG